MLRAAEDLLGALGGRPHWAKRFTAQAADLAPLYPAWDRFMTVHDQLDPGGRFSNRWTERALGTACDA